MRDDQGERDCFLAGQRAVVGDRVCWVVARGSGGKLVSTEPRTTVLRRMDSRGREQLLAANLRGLLVTMSAREPGFRVSLLHRYIVVAHQDGLDLVLILNKTDLGVPEEVEAHLALLEPTGLRVLRTSAKTGEGIEGLRRFLAAEAEGGPWALVGSSGVGKTSLIVALLPDAEVGAIAEISSYWGTGRHATTHSRLFTLPDGGEIADSPGIRNLTPVIRDPVDLRLYFPRVGSVSCKFRDCQHRPEEEGCTAEAEVPAPLLASYRFLLEELTEVAETSKP
ncbi:MAG: ribosome small subunit-dependent GTPase A [Deltaproteobacteria bacterium]|nr:ribosome small subunit-dependent GTPase A [Deltaproteobacteria bacterium]